MMMPERKYSVVNSYRYGFNGKENDNEVKGVEGSQQDYGMRIYNPRLGKFLSVDPLTQSYPYYTPYQFAGNMPIIAIDLDGKEPAYMIDANGKLTKPVIALLMTAFGGRGTDWSEKRLIKSRWKKNESMRKTPNIRAETNWLANGQTIMFNPLFEEKELKGFSENIKFDAWLNLIAHEEYHIMQQDWGILSMAVAGIQSLFEDEPQEKLLEAPAYSYGHPFSNTTEVADLIKFAGGKKLFEILSDVNKSESDKIKEVSLMGLNYRKNKLVADKIKHVDYLKKEGNSTENNLLIKYYNLQIAEVEEKIKELSVPATISSTTKN